MLSDGYYGFRFVMPLPPQCVKRFHRYRSNEKILQLAFSNFDVVRFDLGSLLQGRTRIAKPKSAYNSLGVDILFLLFRRPPSRCLVSAHLKVKYLSYLYQIWYGGLFG